jgi:serine/threonine protein kinase
LRIIPQQNQRNLCRDFSNRIIYKVYDYRFLNTNENHRKSYILSQKYLPSFQLVINLPDIQVFSYEYIEGKHFPNNSKQVLYLLRFIKNMHDDGNIHGDIRCSNILCGADETKSQLIDFDFSGSENIKKYPIGFSNIIEDGKRHKDAIVHNFLKKEHDYFSLVYIFKLNITVVKQKKNEILETCM